MKITSKMIVILFCICACAGLPKKEGSVYKKKLEGRYSCYLNAKHLILAGKHFRFNFNKHIDYKKSEIVLKGVFTANSYHNYVKKNHPTKLRKIDIAVLFLGSDRSGLIHSDRISLEFHDENKPSIFENIPFEKTFPFCPEYVYVSFQYSAEVEFIKGAQIRHAQTKLTRQFSRQPNRTPIMALVDPKIL